MPTRKQRRREAKLRRHEWEEVYLDAEGREVPVEEVEEELGRGKPSRDGRAPKASRNGKPARDSKGRAVREIPPPSWRRVLKRGALFGPLMFIVLVLVNQQGNPATQFLLAAFYTALLIPFMYLMDRFAYRAHLRRVARVREQGKKPRS